MKTAILAAIAIVSLTGAAYLSQTSPRMLASQDLFASTAWKSWKMQHGRAYGNNAEEQYRFKVFQDNMKLINESNSVAGRTHRLGLNKFADLTGAEFKRQYTGLKGANLKKSGNTVRFSEVNTPDSVDWREHGAVNAVKDQGQCGSCWAFSTIAAVEGANFLATGTLHSLSEQELVDCAGSYGNMGCNGGLMDYGFEYIRDHGISSESAYPYTARDGTCSPSSTVPVHDISGYSDVTQSASQLIAAIAQQPVSVAIEADQSVFQFYTSGVVTSGCGKNLDHGVTAVGYGTDNGQAYILVRNSWGASWGDHGYIKIDATTDQCGITDSASVPQTSG